jgi:hypothetical protein
VTEGKLADLLIVDGDPRQEPGLLAEPDRIWLALQLGIPVAGRALENHADLPDPHPGPETLPDGSPAGTADDVRSE